ncbi:MAG: STAS domain-containing protein [Raoultibacter sp.]
MNIDGKLEGGKLVVALEGRIDSNTAPELEAYLKDNIEGTTSLVIDLEQVQYVSSAGLRVILFAYKEMGKTESPFVVCHPNDYIMEVLDATGFTDILTIER